MKSIEPLLVLLDRFGRASWVSRAEAGVRRDELVGTTIWDWAIAADHALAQRAFADCLVNGVAQDFSVTVDAHGVLVRQRVQLEATGSRSRPVICKSRAVHPQLAFLTPRQRQILRLMARTNCRKQIARQLGLKPSTVDVHCAAMIERLGLHSSVELAVFAVLHQDDL